MKHDTEKLANAIREAAAKAKEYAGVPDGGSCNMDFAYVRVPGMRYRQASDIQARSGVAVLLQTYRFHGRVLKLSIGQGQAARNTQMAEAAYRSLKEQGIDAGVYYQAD